jgi:hypothetical protein
MKVQTGKKPAAVMALLSGEEGFLSERLIASGRVQKKCFDMERGGFLAIVSRYL